MAGKERGLPTFFRKSQSAEPGRADRLDSRRELLWRFAWASCDVNVGRSKGWIAIQGLAAGRRARRSSEAFASCVSRASGPPAVRQPSFTEITRMSLTIARPSGAPPAQTDSADTE